ncbi:MAG: autotransporter-associated beta strand repeat-containing protein, partial [Tepidisphaeraceae bacterium]
SGPPNLTWNNTGGSSPDDGQTWDISHSNNWNNSTAATMYTDGALVTLNDTNNGNYAVTLSTTVSPGSVTVNNSSGNYTISGSGSIAGTTSLTKLGIGTLAISTANTYSGGTIVSAGTLLINPTASPGTNSALPSGRSVSIATGAALKLAPYVSSASPGSGPNVTSSVTISSLSIAGTRLHVPASRLQRRALEWNRRHRYFGVVDGEQFEIWPGLCPRRRRPRPRRSGRRTDRSVLHPARRRQAGRHGQWPRPVHPGGQLQRELHRLGPGRLPIRRRLSQSSVPEPASMGLFALGAIGMLARRRRRAR